MYFESEGSRKTLGDVDILFHDGLYHLFHLVLPNHDYIAHATSRDGLSWKRVENALFLGHPGSWDDSMLWTMHVSPDPHRPGCWRMFYTGISRSDRGLKQRIGLAVSEDLYSWRKAPVSWQVNRHSPPDPAAEPTSISANYDAASCFPLESHPDFYESNVDQGRRWISWRDPFYYREGDQGWLLCSGRDNSGPLTRRGCVAQMKETAENQFEVCPPLHQPRLYDDVEVPNLMKIEGEYYLIGSIREDVKIRYWHTDRLGQPWRSYYDNVLLAKGNYAARICHDDRGTLIWNFFTSQVSRRDLYNILPPPKRLVRNEEGFLRVHTYERIHQRVKGPAELFPLKRLKPDSDGDASEREDDLVRLRGCAAFQAFLFPEELSSFRLHASIKLSGRGKCGIVFRLCRETHDGYYLSFDLMKGVAQLRAWGTDSDATGENLMQFKTLQAGYWYNPTPGKAEIQLVGFGSYLEVSIDDRVVLSLADQSYASGAAGFYVESAELELRNLTVDKLRSPSQSDEHLAVG